MASRLPTISEKDRNPSVVCEQATDRMVTSCSQNTPTRIPRDILQVAISKKHDYFSEPPCGSPTESSNITRVPTLQTSKDHTDPSRPLPEKQLHQCEKSPVTPTFSTFSRAPTINESYFHHDTSTPEEDTERSTDDVSGDSSGTATPSIRERTRSVRWRGVLAMIAGVFSQMLCWGIIFAYGTILAFVSQLQIPFVDRDLLMLLDLDDLGRAVRCCCLAFEDLIWAFAMAIWCPPQLPTRPHWLHMPPRPILPGNPLSVSQYKLLTSTVRPIFDARCTGDSCCACRGGTSILSTGTLSALGSFA